MQRADKRKYHYIYKINRDDGRYYIGMHSTDNLEDGYFGSGKRITRSVKKYGIDRHSKEILEFCSSRQHLKEREKQLVTEDVRNDPLCMNIALGGGGGFVNNAHKQRFINSPRTSGLRGTIKASEISRKSGETRRKNGTTSKGVDWTGKKHTDQTKSKMSASMKGRYDKENNPQFGKSWVTNGVNAFMVKREELPEYLSNGHVLGRRVTRV